MLYTWVKRKLLFLKNAWIEKEYKNMSRKEIYSHIYKSNKWGGKKGEFYSGYGAHSPRLNAAYERMIKKFIKEYSIKSICDLGCGDFYTGSKFADCVERYVGVDIVPELIEHNQNLYGTDSISFECRDIVNEDLPAAQLCIVRQVLQHLSNQEILQFFENAKKYQYILVTERVTKDALLSDYNIEKPHGSSNRVRVGSGIYLDKSPFNKKCKEIRRINCNEMHDMITILIK